MHWNWMKNIGWDKTVEECDEKEIEELLLYRKIVKVESDTLYLDNGTELKVEANKGCGGCNSGWYEIIELNECDNVITNVECVTEEVESDYWSEDYSYKIFVYAEDRKIKILQVDGSDGNGYYGTGYTIYVKFPKDEIE